VSDPRPENPYGKLYTVDFLGNVVDGKKTVYNNQPIETLMKLAAESISKRNESVWFGCDIGKHFAMKQGIADTAAFDYELVYGTGINAAMSKADRLVYGESAMSHAMVLTGVQMDVS
jgi:bleomycin hydrolase